MIHLRIIHNDQARTMRFSLEISVQAVIAEIKEKIGFTGSDHGLFQPAIAGRNKSRWFALNYPLRIYNLIPDSEVYFKKKHRTLNYELIDGSPKSCLIDDSQTVGFIRDTIGKQLGLANLAEYGLRIKGSKEGVWLNPKLGLWEQDVSPEVVLVFDKCFFVSNDEGDLSDPTALHLIYSKAVASVVGGKHPVTMNEAIRLAAIQAQAVHGNFSTSTYLKLEDYMPNQWLVHKRIKPGQINNMIQDEWRNHTNTESTNAKAKYVQTVRQLPTYGITFYTVKVPKPKKGAFSPRKDKDVNIPALIGITSSKIVMMDYETKQVEKEHPLEHLKQWNTVRGKFTFDWGYHEEAYWTVFTEEGEAMCDLISGYIDLIAANRNKGAM